MPMKKILKNEFLAIGWVATVCVAVLAAFAVANAQTTEITTQMSPGDSGDQVSALQTFLAASPSIYPSGLVTGYYGSLTEAAVQAYQCQNGIVCQGDAASTGYGRVGPATLAKIEMQEGIAAGGGVNLPTIAYPSTGADVNAPILSAPTVVTTSTSAAIHWTTNKPAHNSVMYATIQPSLSFDSFATMPNVSAPTFDMSPTVTITGLTPNTTYYYVLDSVDASGNIQYGIGQNNVWNSFSTNP
jgi:peptidoglycan hydrolase-like protein with peptidoglycan-binding domain